MEDQNINRDMYDCELYVIFDRISHRYSSPLPFQMKELAIRYFDSLLANCDNIRTKPSDYELFSIGYYDTSTANLISTGTNFIKSGEDVLEVKENVKGKK